MSFKRTKDLAVKVGTYQAKDGSTKNRYANVGAMMEDESGSKFILIDPCFNFAGVNRDGKDRIMVSMFDVKPKEEQPKVVEPEDIKWQE